MARRDLPFLSSGLCLRYSKPEAIGENRRCFFALADGTFSKIHYL